MCDVRNVWDLRFGWDAECVCVNKETRRALRVVCCFSRTEHSRHAMHTDVSTGLIAIAVAKAEG